MPPARPPGPWSELTAAAVSGVGGYMGVYEIAGRDGRVVRIGYAGGRSRLGLRGELSAELDARGEGAALFRCEATTAYLSRYRELLMVHVHEHGRLPEGNDDDLERLGRLEPA